ncbi:2-oxo acid dehydrogenase subunit E2 [Candidatus Micrarchaeota archaeon]|nr:2-oxo acid dehydrogenase subunit E2 [Candidatus Micrarchaeota archaeon]
MEADRTIVEVETDKAVVELPAPVSGTVLKVNFNEGDLIKVGQTLVVIGEPGEEVEEEPSEAGEKAPEEPVKEPETEEPTKEPGRQPEKEEPEKEGRVLATPATRKLARDLDVDISAVEGTGPGGRVTREDVENAAEGEAEMPEEEPGEHEEEPRERIKIEGGDQRIPLTHMRKVIARRMSQSKSNIPHACGLDFVDVTRLVELREKQDSAFEDVKLTYLPFIVKAVTLALKKFPRFNSQFDEEKNEIIVKASHNIGIAVDTPDGLLVPVISNVELKSIMEIADEIVRLAKSARERELKLDEMKNSTFTITNIGSIGGMYSMPIINPPEVAILGVHRIKDLPLVIEGKVVPRKVMGISLSFDHRVVDGADATYFMNEIKRHLEDPDLLMVDMV